MAVELKNNGDNFFRKKEYKKALAQYARVFCYVNGLYSAEDD